jgi:pyridoxal phosphate enzyme (YggS family)
MPLAERLALIEERILAACEQAGRTRASVQLVAVSKTVTAEIVQEAMALGLTEFGENRPQELWRKAEAVPGAHWHVIGHLQRNKLDRTLPLVTLIHSVDSLRLLEAINAWGRDHQRRVPILLEVNCSREEQKGGFAPEALPTLTDQILACEALDWQGLMTMAAYTAEPEDARSTFADLRVLRDTMRRLTGLPLPHLSMGMSNDFEVAIEEGSTFVRIGTALFSEEGSAG